MEQEQKYAKVVRVYRNSGRKKVIFPRVTLEVAKLHCSDKRTATDKYMDVFYIL